MCGEFGVNFCVGDNSFLVDESSSASTMMTTTTAAVTINSFRFMLFKMLFNLSCDSYVFMIPIALGSDEQ